MKKSLLLIALLCPLWLFAQSESDYRTIKGVVMDSVTNETLIGATVMIDPDAAEAKNLGPKGTITDFDGKFELKVPKAVKYVVVSFVGYKNAKLDVTKTTEFKVMLQPDQEQLTEVVVTGYQQIEKRKSTSAIQTVKMDDIKSIGVASIDQLLEGQVAGMTSIPTNGAPGAPNKMRIRSTVSLTGSTDPLWVLDGMILEGNDIPENFSDKDNIDNLYNTSIAGVNPADIESITILKDASATAIYGARAANGVIVVTTKKGSAGKMRVNASAAMFITTKPDLGKLNLMNASEKVDFELGMASIPELTYRSNYGSVARILSNSGELSAFQEGGFNALSAQTQNEINALRTTGSDWGDLVYQNAVNQQYNISVSGGSEKARYYASIGYYNEEGTTIGTNFERITGTMKTDFDLRDNLTLGLSLFMSHSKRKSYITDSDSFTNPSYYTRNVNPYLNVRDENGKYVYDQDIKGLDDAYLEFNLLEERENTDYWLKNLAFKPMLTLNYKPWSFLSLTTQFSMQLEDSKTEKFADEETYFVRKYREDSNYNGTYFLPDGGIIQNWAADMSQYQWKIQGEFSHIFAERHSVNFMAGFEMRGNKNTNVHTKGFGYDSRALTTQPLVFPDGYSTSSMSSSKWKQYQKTMSEDRYLSYYMTGSYTYDNRYTFFGSMRFDGSNLFGVARKYKYLPLWAASAAWNVNREEFLSNVEWLNDLKLRVSYGLLGNQADAGLYTFASNMSLNGGLGGYIFSDGRHIYTNPAPVIDPNTTWEKVESKNIGLDFGFFGNALTGTVDIFQRDTKDMLGPGLEFPDMFGAVAPQANNARMRNRGWELSLNYRGKIGNDIDYSVGGSVSDAVSEVTEYANAKKNDPYGSWYTGRKVGEIWGYRAEGLIQTQEEADAYNAEYDLSYISGKLWEPGDVKYIDLDGNKVIDRGDNRLVDGDMGDQTIIGNTTPRYQYTFNGYISWKGLSLSVMFQGVGKRDWVAGGAYFWGFGPYAQVTVFKEHMDYWRPDNPGAYYPKPYINSAGGVAPYQDKNIQRTDLYLQNAAYCRLKNLTLSYDLPNAWVHKAGLQKVQVFFSGENLLTFTKLKGMFDPEAIFSSNSYTSEGGKNYPMNRVLSLGFIVNL